MKQREEALRTREVTPGIGDAYTYDEKVAAANDVTRLTGSTDARDIKRLTEANTILRGADAGQYAKASKARSSLVQIDTVNPTVDRYLRAPLMAGNRLIEYMQREATPLVKASDPLTYHDTMLDIVNEESLSHSSYKSATGFSLQSFAALPFSQSLRSGAAATSESFSAGSGGGGNIFDSNLRTKKSVRMSRKMDIDLFKSQQAMRSGFSVSAADLDDNDIAHLRQRKDRASVDLFGTAIVAKSRDAKTYRDAEQRINEHLKREEFFGPYEARFKYANTKITSPFTRALFKALMYAKNTVDIHEKLAPLGQKLINVLRFRLCIQHIMSSTIVMKGGKDTLRTAVGHGKVWLNTEQRGINIINAGFYLGVVRANPNGIAMMPFTFPEGFVGGMGTDLMRDISHFKLRTNEKESMLAFLSPVDETKYEFPLDFMNLPTYKRRDTENAPHNRKWSSSEFACFVIGHKPLADIAGHIDSNKRFYGHAFDISLCCHRGYARYNDQFTAGRTRAIAGTGPRGHPRMNIAGAEKTFNGESVKFPDRPADFLNRV